MDETALPIHTGGKRGLRLCVKKSDPYHDLFVEKVSLAARRSYCTLIAAVSSDPEVLAFLPQVLMPKKEIHIRFWTQAARRGVPAPAQILLHTSGWSTTESMIAYFELLKRALEGKTEKKIVILMDCHPSHVSPHTLGWIRKQNWELMLIPGRLTFLLQPLDVFTFRSFKNKYFREHASHRSMTTDGGQSMEEWLETTCQCICSFFPGLGGKRPFERCGCSLDGRLVRPRLRKFMPLAPKRECRRLTKDEVSYFIGRASERVYDLLFPAGVVKADVGEPRTKRLKLRMI